MLKIGGRWWNLFWDTYFYMYGKPDTEKEYNAISDAIEGNFRKGCDPCEIARLAHDYVLTNSINKMLERAAG